VRALHAAIGSIVLTTAAAAQEGGCARERAIMVETIRAHAYFARDVLPGGISARVLRAMETTPRERFVPGGSCALAHADRPLAIGHGQTISQPFVVALMTELAAVGADDTVLEIGTGSGYQAAVLAPLARTVCTVEIVAPLGEAAAARLKELGYSNVQVKIGDGYLGWPECGPFDAIVVTAALGHVPQPLIDQLRVGGRLVMPLGPAGAAQELTVVEKIAPGATKRRSVTLVRFVPFVRPPN
jgi:protein-L-isoaspartate(D-aspartate) O-methyltransferase